MFEESAAIELYSISRDSDPHVPHIITHCARFLLPAYRAGQNLNQLGDPDVEVQTSVTPRLPRFPFVPRWESSIVNVTFSWLESFAALEESVVSFITPSATFLRYISAGTEAGTTVAWEDWGPQNTRWFEGPDALDHNTCGYRLLTKSAKKILDFNQVHIKKELCQASGPESPQHIVTTPSELSSSIFLDPVMGRLPYREIKVEGMEEGSVFWHLNRVMHMKVSTLIIKNVMILTVGFAGRAARWWR